MKNKRIQLQAIAMHNLTNINVIENKTEVIKELCCIAAYYHLVRAVHNSSIIHSKSEQNAHDVLTYWVSLILFSISCIVIVMSQSVSNMNNSNWPSCNILYLQSTAYCSDCNVTLTTSVRGLHCILWWTYWLLFGNDLLLCIRNISDPG